MNLSKSIEIGCAKRRIRKNQLAKAVGVTPMQVSVWIRRSAMTQSNMISVSAALNMKVSEFIALGEE